MPDASFLSLRQFLGSIKFLWPALVLLLSGLITIYSISPMLFWRQILVACLGFILIIFFLKIDWHSLLNYKWLIGGIYLLTIILLLTAYFSGPIVRHTKSWIILGQFSFQPVELAKISLILLYARFFSRRHISIAKWKTIATSFFLFIIPTLLVLLQPDLGSVLILFGIWFGFLLLSGLPKGRLISAFLVLILAAPWGWNYFLKDYQRQRVLNLFYPQENSLGTNYSLIQSKIAIGSAGWWGKGYGQGTETQLGFLSEPANDFILAAFIEEWGIVAGILLVIVFLILIFKILKIGLSAEQNFEKFIALGAALVFGIQFLLNAGSNVGISPVIGTPSPFLSYGGSNLLISFCLLAILNSMAASK